MELKVLYIFILVFLDGKAEDSEQNGSKYSIRDYAFRKLLAK
jgi:hypothetical protein